MDPPRISPQLPYQESSGMLKRVIFSPTIPLPNPNNAGESYLIRLEEELKDFSTTIVVPDTPANRVAKEKSPTLQSILIAMPTESSFKGRLKTHASSLSDKVFPSRTEHGMRWAIRSDHRVINALKSADLIDLQWPEMAGLSALLRRYLPNTRIIATMHDIDSQKFSRAAKATRKPKDTLRFLAAWARAKRMEKSIADHASTVVVFSAKDQRLLPKTAKSFVIHPPVAADTVVLNRLGSNPPYVMFVGPLHRVENTDAMMFFATDVWPLVRAQVPDARLLIAGRKPNDAESPLFRTAGIELLGFVHDIDQYYARTSAVIAPIRLGAGLKFKVLDALARGVPLIATPVALEGVDTGLERIKEYSSPEEISRAVVESLQAPLTKVAAVGSTLVKHLRLRYGREQFAYRVRGLYGATIPSLDLEARGRPQVSVVIPVKNGENQLSDQLDALASQMAAPLFEVIIADNGSTDRTRSVALAHAHRFYSLRVVDAGAKAGVNFARNAGANAARSEKILICDHDDTVSANWVSALSIGLDETEVVGATTIPVTRESDGRLHEDRASALTLGECLGYLKYVFGGNMGIRRDTFVASGGFDESFWGGHDEVEFSWRLQRMGATIAAVEEAELHYLQRTTPKGTYKQAFNSSRTRIQLWARYHELADLTPVSYRGAICEALRAIRGLPGLLPRETRNEVMHALGSAFGTATGHVKYRLLGSPPPPELADFTVSGGAR